jgi:alpha-galactosidase
MTRPLVLRAAGTALVLESAEGALPRVLHWGADLPDDAIAQLPLVADGPVPPSALDEPWPLTVLPTAADGWLGTPGYAAHRAGGETAPRWVSESLVQGSAIVTTATGNGVEVVLRHALDELGVLTVDLEVSNQGPEVLDVAALRAVLPLPNRAGEVLDLTGRWCRERSPQRSALQHGTHLRASRRGRTGHDATLLLCAGTAGFGFRSGEVWATHVAWSGNHEHLVERLPEGAGVHAAVLGGGELLEPGEIRLGVGETYRAPTVYFVHSTTGLDGVSERLHRRWRASGHDLARSRPRPLVLNVWEAVYFDHDLARLTQLADTAARIGVERFVLDDGWFGGRRDDLRGLGDWWVSPQVWPEGLAPLVEHVRGLGMEFGLWFEPEMVNVDSDLVRQHPDWVLGPRAGHPREWRHQQVLDLANPEAAAHLEAQISALVDEYAIDFIKWDHNRDLLEAVRSDASGVDRPAVHAQTTAFYALLDRLRERHPDLEIESCASGGARVDLGVLARTDRVWTSDCNDALERARIQRWTSLLVPAEVMGTHVGPPTAHTTHRTLDLGFRTLLALQGHAGLEWDITTCSEAELAALTSWSALYRELRDLLHSGDLVRDTADDGTLLVTGTVARGGEQAAYSVVRTDTSAQAVPGLVRLPGLDPARTYSLRVRPEAGVPQVVQHAAPRWWDEALAGLTVSGALLTEVGLPMPVLAPAQGFLLHLT